MLPGKLSVKNTKKIPVIDTQSRVAEFANGLPNAKPEELSTLINPEFSLGQPSGLYLPADEPSKASVCVLFVFISITYLLISYLSSVFTVSFAFLTGRSLPTWKISVHLSRPVAFIITSRTYSVLLVVFPTSVLFWSNVFLH